VDMYKDGQAIYSIGLDCVYFVIRGNQKGEINPSIERKGTEAFCRSL
jgi:hypothetical protein